MTNTALLAPDQIAQYRRDGYLIVPHLLTPQELDAFIQHEAAVDPNAPRGLQNHRADPQWGHLAHHPRVTGIIRQLIEGPPEIVQTMYMAKQPDGGTGVALHQDTHYIRNEPNTLMACWIAFSATDPDNGGLCVAPGSHLEGLGQTRPNLNTQDHAAWENTYPMRGPDGQQWDEPMSSHDIVGFDRDRLVRLTVPRGAGVFFTSLTIHGSFRNQSADRPRLAFATHYVCRGTWVYRQDLQDMMPVA